MNSALDTCIINCFCLMILLIGEGCEPSLESISTTIDLDSSQCAPSCSIKRYKIALLRSTGNNERCTFYSSTTSEKALSVLGQALHVGDDLFIGVAAFCDPISIQNPTPKASEECCKELSACINQPTIVQCQKAHNVCQIPKSTIVRTFYDQNCKDPTTNMPSEESGDCVRCYTLVQHQLKEDDKITLKLKTSSSCQVNDFAMPACPSEGN